jgi:hypothetical protein
MIERYASSLRYISERIGLPSVKVLAAAPGTQAVYRVTVHHDRLRAVDVIATLRRTRMQPIELEVVYVGLFNNKPLHRRFTEAEAATFFDALNNLHFDHLYDQSEIPFYGADMWLVERAAGSYKRDVLVAPQTATGIHAHLVDVLQQYLPEITRELSE